MPMLKQSFIQKNMLKNYARENNLKHVIGLDEVGRGPFAGPVVTAGVILPPDFESELIVDSKLICKSKSKMQVAYDLIMDNALFVHCDSQSAKVINEIGIEAAIWKSMDNCIVEITHALAKDTGFSYFVDHILIDGTRYGGKSTIPFTTVVKGDNTYLSIAAAAIVAKYRRDAYMDKVHDKHPYYGFDGNKGYYSSKHKTGLLEHGRCSYHRTQYVDTWEENQLKQS